MKDTKYPPKQRRNIFPEVAFSGKYHEYFETFQFLEMACKVRFAILFYKRYYSYQ